MRFFVASSLAWFLCACGPIPVRKVRTLPDEPVRVADEAEPADGEVLSDLGPGDTAEDTVGGGPAAEAPPAPEREPHPFADLPDQVIEQMLDEDPASLGSVSIGRPAAGRLMGAVPMPEDEAWVVVNPVETWGTQETVDYLAHNIRRVYEQFPDTPPLPIGDIGRKEGGHLRPHLSHQSGRDVDVGYYYVNGADWYTPVTQDNLDFARTWAFVKSIVVESDVQAIFMDIRVQRMLRDYALEIGEDPAWLEQLFGGGTSQLRPLITHEPGHRTHIHIRYYNPIAQETGRRLYHALLQRKLIEPPTYFVHYKAKRGDTLITIARRFQTSVAALKRANGLRSSRLYAGRTYKIPRRGGIKPPPGPLSIPERRLPPDGSFASRPAAELTAENGPF